MSTETGLDSHNEDHLGVISKNILRAERGYSTSGLSSATGFSRISHSTPTGVLGLIAMPACISCAWINLISSFGFVFLSDFSSGDSAAVESIAAS